jgi:SAM-dependent methyltransferase
VRSEKEVVRRFYDTFGWRKRPDGRYEDTAAFVDTRPVLSDYHHKVHLRLKELIRPTGEYFLDAGSGPVAHASSIEYSSGYRRRVCVDLSLTALSEARSKLAGRGLYVIADLTQLPFRDLTFDASICAHALYHVPEDEQRSVILELYRTLKRDRRCIIVYSWPTSLFRSIPRLFGRVRRRALRWRQRSRSEAVPSGNGSGAHSDRPALYFHAHGRRWFRDNVPRNWAVEIRCWRSVGRDFTTEFVGDGTTGRLLMGLIYRLERMFPRRLARLGQYPMLVITRT